MCLSNDHQVDATASNEAEQCWQAKFVVHLGNYMPIIEHFLDEVVYSSLHLYVEQGLDRSLPGIELLDCSSADADFKPRHARVLGIADSLVEQAQLVLGAKDLYNPAANRVG